MKKEQATAAVQSFADVFTTPAVNPTDALAAIHELASEALALSHYCERRKWCPGTPDDCSFVVYRADTAHGRIEVSIAAVHGWRAGGDTVSVWQQGLHGLYVERKSWPAWLPAWINARRPVCSEF